MPPSAPLGAVRSRYLRFDPFLFDPKTRLLTAAGQTVRITRKAGDLLFAFLNSPGQVLSKDELRTRAWGPDVRVEDSALERQIADLRKALHGVSDRVWIETFPKRGYRFVGTVEDASASSASGTAEKKPMVASVEPSSGGKSVWMPLAAAAALVFIAEALVSRSNIAAFPASHQSVAIVKFRLLSAGVHDEWLSMAVPHLIRTGLADPNIRLVSDEESARVQLDLKLPAADSFSPETLSRIRRMTGADFVIVGAVTALSKSADPAMRVDIHIQSVRSGLTFRALSVTGPSLSEVVAKADLAIRGALNIKTQPADQDRLASAILPVSPPGREAYFSGLEKLRALDAKAALPLLEKAAAQDPNSAWIESAIAEAWAILGYPVAARNAARRAWDLSGDLSQLDRLEIEARYRALASEWIRAIDIERSLWMVLPEQPYHALQLAEAQTAIGKPQEALATIADLRRTSHPTDPRLDLTEAAAYEASGQFAKEVGAARRAAERARQTGSKSLLAHALLRECWGADNLGDWTTATDSARSAKEIFAGLGDLGGEALALRYLADVLDDHDDHAEAAKIYRLALDRFRSAGHERGVAGVLNNMGHALRNLGDLDGAQKNFGESLAISHRVQDEALEALALNGVGIVAWRQGRLEVAKRAYQRAMDIHTARQDQSRAATVRGNLALVEQDMGDLAAARRDLEGSLADMIQTGDQPGVARTLGNLGDLAMRNGRLAEAQERYSEHLRVGIRLNDDKQRAYALSELAQVHFLQGDLDASHAKLVVAVNLRSRLGEKGLVAEAQLLLARTMLAQQQGGEAATEAKAAMTEFQTEKERDLAITACALLTRALVMQGKIAEALRGSQECDLTAIKDVALKLTASIDMARARCLLGDRDSARTILRQAHEIAQNGGYVPDEMETRLLLSRLSSEPNANKPKEDIAREATQWHLGLIAREAAQPGSMDKR